MAKIGRNDSCPCGSGKKFKKCCLGKKNPDLGMKEATFSDYLRKENVIGLMKIFSILQFLPENHDKTVRLETIQDTLISHLNEIQIPVDYTRLKLKVNKFFDFDHREDPSEIPFTQNIKFFNGNNVVFPGIANNSTEVNQVLLNSIFFYDNSISKETKIFLKEGILFLLHILNELAESFGLQRNEYKATTDKKIFFPSQKFLNDHGDKVVFSPERIREICHRLKIDSKIIGEFSASPGYFTNNYTENTFLIERPFIKIGDICYLLLPSSQMYCMNSFIFRVAKERGELEELRRVYDLAINDDIRRNLNSFWKIEEIELDLKVYEYLYRIDTDKVALVKYLGDNEVGFVERTEEVLNEIKCMIKEPLNIMVLFIYAQFKIEDFFSIAVPEIKKAEYQMIINAFDLERLVFYWDIESLSLWKYARARERFESEGRQIMPFYSNLTYFKWYMGNSESFFPIDDRAPDVLIFDYSMQGSIIIEAEQKKDKHLVQYIESEEELGYLPVFRKETHAPIYISEDIYNGFYRVVIEKYNCPIWISCENRYDFLGKNFVEAASYWINELENLFRNVLEHFDPLPIEIVFSFDKDFEQMLFEHYDLGGKLNIEYEVNPKIRKIRLNIPKEIFKVLHRSDNYGEFIITDAILRGLKNLGLLYDLNISFLGDVQGVLREHMPLSRSKLIFTADPSYNPKLSDIGISKPRFIYDADTSIILEENAKWLGEIHIPEKLKNVEEKQKLSEQVINSLIFQIRNRIKEFDNKKLLKALILRHEAILHTQARRDQGITMELAAFGKYQDVIEQYEKKNTETIKSSHALRCLIEFVVAEPYFGDKIINDCDLDFLVALMVELTNYGVIKDIVKFELDNPEMGRLPSGRIGVSKDFFEKVLMNYRRSVTEDELYSYSETFDGKFKSINPKEDEKKDNYYDKVDSAFEEDFGVSLSMIIAAMETLMNYSFFKKQSYYCCDKSQLKTILADETQLNNNQIDAFLGNFILESRGEIDKPKDKSDYPEIFPWRYNRKFSYLRKPILEYKTVKGTTEYMWSARHIHSASENLLAIFHDGSLKVEKNQKKISKLIAERNVIKGKEFRNMVYRWLKDNTVLEIIDHEVKINEHGYFKADRNYGDVDIMAYDREDKIVYSIECKNTKQAKIIYDFQNDLKNYLTKQLPKHKNREIYLKSNLDKISRIFGRDISLERVQSVVISSYSLPIKFTENLEVPIYSFNEIKRGESLFRAKA